MLFSHWKSINYIKNEYKISKFLIFRDEFVFKVGNARIKIELTSDWKKTNPIYLHWEEKYFFFEFNKCENMIW